MSVQSEIDRINGAKSTIAANIKDSGVSVQEGARLEVLAPLVGDIVGQFSDELDMIIGGDTTPVTDITARLSSVNGVIGDVSTQLDTLDGTKTAIKDAIVAKGVDIPDGTVFRDYAAKIGEIQAGSGTAKVTSSYTSSSNFFYVFNGEFVSDPTGSKEFYMDKNTTLTVAPWNSRGEPTPTVISGDAEIKNVMTGAISYAVIYVYGDCAIG